MRLFNNSITKTLGFLLFMGTALALSACEQDGPMENAGEEIDEAAEDVRDSVEDAADEVEDDIDDH